MTSSDDKDSVENKRILDDLHLHVKELEERRAKIQPIINLVDNMVRSCNFANNQPILLLVLQLVKANLFQKGYFRKSEYPLFCQFLGEFLSKFLL